jgi:hypothetical protein
MKVQQIQGVATKNPARKSTERHGDQGRDQERDHVTKTALPNLPGLAGELLEAVAEGRPESVEMAQRIAEAVLDLPLVRRAAVLRDLLRDGSPFALVRAVELAELVLGEPAAAVAKPTARS